MTLLRVSITLTYLIYSHCALLLQKDAQCNNDQFKPTTKIELPFSFVTYADLTRGDELSLLLRTNKYKESSANPNLFSGQLQIERVSLKNPNC